MKGRNIMEEAMDLLEDIRDLDLDMQNLGRKIDAIDSSVRNRAYTVLEIAREDQLQEELKEKRKERDELINRLQKILEDEKIRKLLEDKLKRDFQAASTSEERSEIGQYNEIVRQAVSNIFKEEVSERLKRIQETKEQAGRFGQRYARREDDRDR